MKLTLKKDERPLPERIAHAFTTLTSSSRALNKRSDEYASRIQNIDQLIQKLNLGVEAWVQTEGGWEDDNQDFEHHFVGYTRFHRGWGLALKTVTGNDRNPERDRSEEWPFNEAPRAIRILGVAKIPELLERLAKKADAMTEKIGSASDQSKELAEFIKDAADEQSEKK